AIGAALGDLSPMFFAGSVSFGGGAMLYLTLRELIPEAISMHKSAATWISIAAGVLFGFVLVVLV
ncbi:MAG: zinc/iron permease, partial [Christensenella sp.]|nr:zinc/iron permease [Christensenella sp.]